MVPGFIQPRTSKIQGLSKKIHFPISIKYRSKVNSGSENIFSAPFGLNSLETVIHINGR